MPLKRMRLKLKRAGMTATKKLSEILPKVRGKLAFDAPLASHTWFRVGGNAEALFSPADTEDLAAFLAACPPYVPVTVIGVASNLLVRDGGISGAVVRLGPEFARIRVESREGLINAGAAAMDLNVARAAQAAGLAGLEFMSGIPGTVGGGLRMNAGAYGGEFKDVTEAAIAVDRQGKTHTLKNSDMGFSYRRSAIPDDWIFASAVFRGQTGDGEAIRAKMAEIQQKRSSSQPIREKTGGSTFANPDNDPQGRKAWQLIDAAGCRGLRMGGAQMSEQHCNFLINRGDATAADIENLGEEVRRRVREKTGVELRWEIRRIGNPLPPRE